MWVIRLMNDPGPEALEDPTLIMLREPHLGGARGGGRLLNRGGGRRFGGRTRRSDAV